jgi:RNA polymerase sigma factor (sigma-70 family)
MTPHRLTATWKCIQLPDPSAWQQDFLDFCELLVQTISVDVGPPGIVDAAEECQLLRVPVRTVPAVQRRPAQAVDAMSEQPQAARPGLHDAEDAFQATFLVLVRKAASVVPREMVASWLYGVARQTVLKARATTARRQRRERQVTTMPEASLAHDTKNDLQPVLDEELHRLPDMYRVAIILCDLEGKTRKETARQLGCPEGTLTARLARGRTMLAKRMAGRGVALSAGALAALLPPAATACVPSSVLSSTVKAVTLLAAGQAAAGQISVKVAALTDAVIKAMLLTKLKNVIVGLLVVAAAVVGFGGGWGGRLPRLDGSGRTGASRSAQVVCCRASEAKERR